MSRHLYHHTSQMPLPRILRDGELRPMIVRPEYRAELNRMVPGRGDTAEYVYATSDPNGDAASTIDAAIADDKGRKLYEDGKLLKVRFTVDADDFEPWRTVVGRDPGWTPNLIDAATLGAQRLGTNASSWYARAEPLPVSKVIAIHVKWFDKPWVQVDDRAEVFTISDDPEIMGISFGKLAHWSEHDILNHRDAHSPIAATDIDRTLEVAPDCVMTKARFDELLAEQEREEQPKHEPEVIAANVLAFQNKKPDPLASIVSSFKPKLPASPNAEIVTTPVRYHLDTDLFKAFEYAQVQEYKAQLIAEGRWRLPNDGGRYTIRFNYWDVPEVFGFEDKWRSFWNGPDDGARARGGGGEWFIDFDMAGETMTRTTDVVRMYRPGLSLEQKKTATVSPREDDGRGYDYTNASAWWEANGWFVHRCDYSAEAAPLNEIIARNLLDVLVISLMDRSVVRVITDRPAPSKKWTASGLAHPEQDVQEITIYCPGRVTGGDGTGTHASPRMHWRRGHNRTLTKGRDMPLVVPIAPVWVNADEESEKIIPLRSYKVKASAAEASPTERGRKRA
jgi:hypothetical protein